MQGRPNHESHPTHTAAPKPTREVCTWYASEFDGEDIFFVLMVGFEIELGDLSLKEMKETRGPLGLPIERDLYFEPKSLRELMEKHRQDRGE